MYTVSSSLGRKKPVRIRMKESTNNSNNFTCKNLHFDRLIVSPLFKIPLHCCAYVVAFASFFFLKVNLCPFSDPYRVRSVRHHYYLQETIARKTGDFFHSKMNAV